MKNALRTAKEGFEKITGKPYTINVNVYLDGEKQPEEELRSGTKSEPGEFNFEGRVEDQPIFRIVADLFGLDESVARQDKKIIQATLEMAAKKVGSDQNEIIKYIRKCLREVGGRLPHRTLYRILQMEKV